ncbi:hypothetical protein [Futiania mangrovi]|uniref:Uncharacterized protein n=1 Tax=Futiania mangrovi TaxID=2959716 RepID=A0A9J6PNZ1_9PROT|nr:hypothetical protein [Futiania mangrovii]MCP1337810.1 hypothetical protein [Futiania mangrovii]
MGDTAGYPLSSCQRAYWEIVFGPREDDEGAGPELSSLLSLIVGGKLSLIVNAAMLEKDLKNREEVIAIAYVRWPDIRSTPVEDL